MTPGESVSILALLLGEPHVQACGAESLTEIPHQSTCRPSVCFSLRVYGGDYPLPESTAFCLLKQFVGDPVSPPNVPATGSVDAGDKCPPGTPTAPSFMPSVFLAPAKCQRAMLGAHHGARLPVIAGRENRL